MEVKLIVANGKQAGKVIPVAVHKFLIGRGEGCHLRPQCSEVSRTHCAILIEEGVAIIEDCGSTNGTFLNDHRLSERRELKDGDRIRVGMLALEVRLSVGIGSEKKPKVHTIQEAAARTVASPPAVGDELDISGWLGDESTLELAPTRKQPATAGDTISGKAGDTMAGKSMEDTGTMPAPNVEKKSEAKKEKNAPAKSAGKLRHPPLKPTAGDSGAAADNALRHFFHRRKP